MIAAAVASPTPCNDVSSAAEAVFNGIGPVFAPGPVPVLPFPPLLSLFGAAAKEQDHSDQALLTVGHH